MKRCIASSLAVVFVAFFLLAVLVPSAEAQGYIRRYAANFRAWGAPDVVEISTTTVAALAGPPGAGGVVIYDKSFATSDDVNVIYVTISTTGDTHAGAKTQFAALLDGASCNRGSIPVGAGAPGWITLQRHQNYNLNGLVPGFVGDGAGGAGDMHDNSIHYTWCCRAEPLEGLRNVKVKMASSCSFLGGCGPAGTETRVFIEGAHFYIDGSNVKSADRCVVDTTPLPPFGSFP